MLKKVLFIFLLLGFTELTVLAHQKISLPLPQGFISVPGEKLYYQRCGTLGRGTPIVVLHGGPGMDQSYLLPQMLELAKDRDVVFYDQRGSDKSSKQPWNPDQINMQR